MKLYALEVYVTKDLCDKLINDVLKLVDCNNVYFCKYESEKEHMTRIGFRNITKANFNKIHKKIKGISIVKKTNINNPPEWHYDTELMKYLAFKIYRDMKEHFKDNKKYYLKSDTRKQNMFDYPNTKEQKLEMDSKDWLTMLHHVMNLHNYDYARENMIYNFCSTVIDYSEKVSNVRS